MLRLAPLDTKRRCIAIVSSCPGRASGYSLLYHLHGTDIEETEPNIQNPPLFIVFVSRLMPLSGFDSYSRCTDTKMPLYSYNLFLLQISSYLTRGHQTFYSKRRPQTFHFLKKQLSKISLLKNTNLNLYQDYQLLIIT